MDGRERKPYTAPKLTVYGPLVAITQTSVGGNKDDSGGKSSKT